MAGKTLASKTGQVRYNVPGPIGPLVYPAGEYDAATKYIRTALSAPMVLDDGQYYVLNKEGAFTGIRPKYDYATNGSNATWVLMEYVKYAFVEVLMANFAKLASAVFYGDYMFSMYGTDANDNQLNDESSYRNFNPDDPMSRDNAFKPNLLFDMRMGKVYTRMGEFSGLVCKHKCIINSGNYTNYLKQRSGSSKYTINLDLTGTYIYLSPGTPALHIDLPTAVSTGNEADKEDARKLVGTKLLVYNDSGNTFSFSGSVDDNGRIGTASLYSGRYVCFSCESGGDDAIDSNQQESIVWYRKIGII